MASVTLIHTLAGRERAATAQAVLSSTSLSFGAITGSIVGGILLDQLGAVGIFRLAAGGMLVALLIYVASIYKITSAQTRISHQQQDAG